MSKNKLIKLSAVAVATLSILGLSLWSYQRQNTKIQEKEDAIAKLQKSVNELKNQQASQNSQSNSDSTATDEKNTEPQSNNTESKYLDIKELGIKVELDENTKDAYYVVNTYTDPSGAMQKAAYLSTTTLVSKDPLCKAEAGSSGVLLQNGEYQPPQAICSNGSLAGLEEKIVKSFSGARITKY